MKSGQLAPIRIFQEFIFNKNSKFFDIFHGFFKGFRELKRTLRNISQIFRDFGGLFGAFRNFHKIFDLLRPFKNFTLVPNCPFLVLNCPNSLSTKLSGNRFQNAEFQLKNDFRNEFSKKNWLRRGLVKLGARAFLNSSSDKKNNTPPPLSEGPIIHPKKSHFQNEFKKLIERGD